MTVILRRGIILTVVLSAIQALMLVIILFPVVVLYMLGVYISAGVGLWRLIEHDFGSADGGANLKPALEVLYSLAVAQGVLFCYKTVYVFGAKFGLAEFVAGQLLSVDKDLVSAYLEDTVAGCEKDPSFARGRNLVTYAVDLIMEAKANDGFIAGVKVLGAVIASGLGQGVLAKHLLMRSASSSHIIQRLLQTIGPRSPYSSKIRAHAARIVALVASSIHLEQYPRWIESISSLLDTFEEYSWVPEDYWRLRRLPKDYERDWLLDEYERRHLVLYCHKESNKRTEDSSTSSEGTRNNLLREYYGRLVEQGFILLQKLAVREDNCKAIMNAKDLLMKITAPLISQQKLHVHEDPLNQYYSNITEASMMLMMQLMATPGNIGTKLCSEILGRKEEIINKLDSILKCPKCEVQLQRRALEILLDLDVNTSSIAAIGNSVKRLNWMLLLVFLCKDDDFAGTWTCRSIHLIKKSSYIRRLAGEKLSDMLSSSQEPSDMPPLRQSDGGSARSMLQSVRIVLGDITTGLVDAGNISNRVHAAKILHYLCGRYSLMDYEYHRELKKAMTNVMPEVLREILGYVLVPAVAEANNVQPSVQDIHLESGGVSRGHKVQESTSSSRQQKGKHDMELQEALLSLCLRIHWNWQGEDDPGLTRQLDDIAQKVCAEHGQPLVKDLSHLLGGARVLLEQKKAEGSAGVPTMDYNTV